jgi:hypothetical protein
MILIGALDSSLLSLPEINDYLVVARCYAHKQSAFLFPDFSGDWIGTWLSIAIHDFQSRRAGGAPSTISHRPRAAC